MTNPSSSTFKKYFVSSKVLLLLVVLIGLGGAWKIIDARTAAAQPRRAATPPYVYPVKDINTYGALRFTSSVVVGKRCTSGPIVRTRMEKRFGEATAPRPAR